LGEDLVVGVCMSIYFSGFRCTRKLQSSFDELT
jgi:hypothetical protein